MASTLQTSAVTAPLERQFGQMPGLTQMASTSSGGASYKLGDNHYFLDWTAGTGLRSGFANTDHLPAYWQWNAAVSHEWAQSAVGALNLRLTVVNLLDRVYELRDGTGIGVGAPQYGQRRTFYVSVSHPFGA